MVKTGDPYADHRERARARQAKLSESGRNIGEIPPVAYPRRRSARKRNLRRFCEAYFPQTFSLAWSDDHLKVIAKIEQAVLRGGLFAIAMPRGSGKTSLCEAACIWSLLYGHRRFVCLIGADKAHAEQMLDSIKLEFETNEDLSADFPEVCFPIQALEGIHQRAKGQLYHGKLTRIGWTAEQIVLPSIPNSIASGGIIRVAGITGSIRGMKYKRSDGVSVRPDLILVDDPQTYESAMSPTQCATRERILAGDVLGLAGPNKKIAGLMPMTVVRQDDLADRILDHQKHPEWQGERTKMVYAFPRNEKLWEEYARIRAESLCAGKGLKPATEFYRKNRKAMDEGAAVAWKGRFNADEISALQHAMNLKLQDEAAFWAEYQNEPMPEDDSDSALLSAAEIARKTNGEKRGVVPAGCSCLTMFIDVQGKLLYYLVAAWAEDFTGYVIDYGTEPDQHKQYFSLRDATRTLGRAAPRAGMEGAIYAGLERLTKATLGREWTTAAGGVMRIDRCLVDANWGASTDVVYQFCRQSDYAGIILPSHGRFVGPGDRPMIEWKKNRGDRAGFNWRMPAPAGKRAVRHVIYDTNFWKTFVHARLAVAMGDVGCLSLWGKGNKAVAAHRMLADHLTAEHCVKTEGRGRTVDVWKVRAKNADNHLFDCLVGAAVAASMQGVALPGMDAASIRRKRQIRISEELRRKRERR